MASLPSLPPRAPRPIELQTATEAGRYPGSLPAPATSLIGREAEIAELRALLLHSDVRLVTLTGPGGVGKTRLAIRVAELLRDSLEDGAWFIDLASVRDPALVPGWIAQRLGLRTGSSSVPEAALAAFLRPRQMLLVLDNLEHLLGAGPFIAGLLEHAPRLQVLATSRATLHVYGEHRWQVPPLATRVPASSSSPDQEMKIPAVELFAERAAAADRTFALTDENASTVAELCCRLEGLPLAIELAAARIAMLSPAALLKRMEPRLPVLIGGQHGQPERFRTMRQAIAWSYDLLSPADQALLRRLALFVGGFTVEAAEAVSIPLETTAGVAAEALFDSLSRLTDQSLLQRESIGEDVRFSMLEVVREFGLDALASCGELEPAKRRHAAYYLELGRALAPGLSGFEMVRNLARLEVDLPNIRAALSWALDRRQVETALRLAAELYPFWNYRGHLTEGRSWLAAALEQRGSQPQTRIDGLLAASGLAALQGDYASARSHCREAASLASQQSYPFGIARALLLQGIITEWQGDYREAAAIYAECNHHIAELGEHQWRSRLLALQAEVDAILGQTALAEQRARSALREAEGEGHAWNAGIATGVLAYLSLKRGETEEATRLYWENLSRYQDLGDHRGIGGAIAGFAGIALQIGRKQEAVRLLGAACAIGDEIGVAHLGNKGLVERLDAMARAGMQPAAYKTAWDAGHALGREWALAKAESIAGEVLKRHDAPLPDPLEGSGLTRREGEVLYLLARRLTDKEIAGALSISPRTAMNHVAHVIAKLGLANRRDVARWAREHGLA